MITAEELKCSLMFCGIFLSLILRNSPWSPPNNPRVLNESKLCWSGALGTRGKCLIWWWCCWRAGVHCLAGNETRIFFICSRHQMVFFRHAAYSGGLKNLQLSDTVMSTWNEMLWILFYRYHGVSNRNMNCFQYRGNLGRKIGPPSILSYYHGAFQLQQARGLNKKCTYIILWFFSNTN